MNTGTLAMLLSSASTAWATQSEVILPVPNSKAAVALSTRGATALRVRYLPFGVGEPIDTVMVGPDAADAPFTRYDDSSGHGIRVDGLGSVGVSLAGQLVLRDAQEMVLTKSAPYDPKA